MATIRTNKDGSKSYQVRYPDPNKPGRQRSQTFRTERRAEKLEAAIKTDRDRGTSNDPKLGRESLNSYWAGWYNRAQENRSSGTEHTVEVRVRLQDFTSVQSSARNLSGRSLVETSSTSSQQHRRRSPPTRRSRR